ncbi:hypothetical protein E2C01_040951 [Portunus trituberculatus]|uniref:Uncharacterized protein n=1 Tax=Portunus trituberculatus TaxID=210409 RepID=A0A5B7FQ56_PORTR|nr:hypothetical protein [Portunus trituberculatus]
MSPCTLKPVHRRLATFLLPTHHSSSHSHHPFLLHHHYHHHPSTYTSLRPSLPTIIHTLKLPIPPSPAAPPHHPYFSPPVPPSPPYLAISGHSYPPFIRGVTSRIPQQNLNALFDIPATSGLQGSGDEGGGDEGCWGEDLDGEWPPKGAHWKF